LERVPDGDTITTYVPIGTSMTGGLGVDIDTGKFHEGDKYHEHVYKAGHLMPNFTFAHLSDPQGKHVYTVSGTTTLNAVLATVKGKIWIAACAAVYIPVGQTADVALKDLPVRSAGAEAPVGTVSVNINGFGGLVAAK
jgi:putative adhesin Stv-like protein